MPREKSYGRQGPSEMTVEYGWPQVHQIRKNASNETSCNQTAELWLRQSDGNNEQDEAKGNIDTGRNRIRMRNVIHDPVLHYSRRKADHSISRRRGGAVRPDEVRAWVELEMQRWLEHLWYER